jgi:hypothetical protein
MVATGLLVGVLATALGAFAIGHGDAGAPVSAQPAPGEQLGDLGATQPYTTEPTVTITATATITEPTATATDVPTVTATATATATDTPPPTITPSPAPTRTPHPSYLPVLLRDPVCVPQAHYSDIVFVVDVSYFMDNSIDGLVASEWARYWMRQSVDHLDMSHTRLGLVQFNRDVTVRQHLTNDRQAILDAIATKPIRENTPTRMDVALRVARNMLLGENATPGNSKVIFFISLMQARDMPWRTVPGCVEQRGDECAVLAAAREVKEGPGNITIYALASSWYGGGEDLKAVASDPSKAILMPTTDDMARICRHEVVSISPCPDNLYWPRAKP